MNRMWGDLPGQIELAFIHGGSCVNCHGVSRKGGVPIMMAFALPVDIIYDALTSQEHEMDDGEEHGSCDGVRHLQYCEPKE